MAKGDDAGKDCDLSVSETCVTCVGSPSQHRADPQVPLPTLQDQEQDGVDQHQQGTMQNPLPEPGAGY